MANSVGKTTLTAMEAYLLAKEGKRVLIIDSDPQGSISQMISKTYHEKLKPRVSFYNGLVNMDLSKSIVHVSTQLDIIPTNWKLSLWSSKIAEEPKNVRPWILNHLLMPIKKHYDYVFIDVMPSLTQYVLNAIFASDGISIVLQTQEMAYQSALLTTKELYSLKKQYPLDFKFLGVVLYLFQNAKVDRDITNEAKKAFNGVLYANEIKNQQRVKGFGSTGIIDNNDHWNKRAITMYQLITNELEYKIKKMIK